MRCRPTPLPGHCPTLTGPAPRLRSPRPVDTFSIMNDAILNRVLGVVLTFTRTGTAIKIVPPLDCYLTGEVDQATGTIKPVKKLVVKAHVVALVANHADLNAPRFRVDTDAFAYTQADLNAYGKSLARAINDAHANGQGQGIYQQGFAQWAQVRAPPVTPPPCPRRPRARPPLAQVHDI